MKGVAPGAPQDCAVDLKSTSSNEPPLDTARCLNPGPLGPGRITPAETLDPSDALGREHEGKPMPVLLLMGYHKLLTAPIPPVLTLPLVRTLAGALARGCMAGVICGIAIAHWQPELRALLSDENGVARALFLIACMQVGVAVAVAIAMIPRRDRAD